MKFAVGGKARLPKVLSAAAAVCVCLAGTGVAYGSSRKTSPLPPPRPPAAALPLPAPAAPAILHCGDAAAGAVLLGDMQPPAAAREGCGIAAPVLLKAIILRNGAKAALVPPALLNCPFAEALAQWLRDEVDAAMPTDMGHLAAVETAGAYECRGRNRFKDARLSEHATGNALDISAFVTDRAGRFEIARQADAPALFQTLRQSACLRFMTVLGPGSDGFHETHLHLDLQARANGAHFCQWTIN